MDSVAAHIDSVLLAPNVPALLADNLLREVSVEPLRARLEALVRQLAGRPWCPEFYVSADRAHVWFYPLGRAADRVFFSCGHMTTPAARGALALLCGMTTVMDEFETRRATLCVHEDMYAGSPVGPAHFAARRGQMLAALRAHLLSDRVLPAMRRHFVALYGADLGGIFDLVASSDGRAV